MRFLPFGDGSVTFSNLNGSPEGAHACVIEDVTDIFIGQLNFVTAGAGDFWTDGHYGIVMRRDVSRVVLRRVNCQYNLAGVHVMGNDASYPGAVYDIVMLDCTLNDNRWGADFAGDVNRVRVKDCVANNFRGVDADGFQCSWLANANTHPRHVKFLNCSASSVLDGAEEGFDCKAVELWLEDCTAYSVYNAFKVGGRYIRLKDCYGDVSDQAESGGLAIRNHTWDPNIDQTECGVDGGTFEGGVNDYDCKLGNDNPPHTSGITVFEHDSSIDYPDDVDVYGTNVFNDQNNGWTNFAVNPPTFASSYVSYVYRTVVVMI